MCISCGPFFLSERFLWFFWTLLEVRIGLTVSLKNYPSARKSNSVLQERDSRIILSLRRNKMKKLVMILAVVLCVATSAFGVPTIEFSSESLVGWSYDGLSTFTLSVAEVDAGLGNRLDALVGAVVDIPNLAVGGIPGGPYTLTPTGCGTITIKSTGGIVYLTGTLGSADLVPVGTIAGGYTVFQVDITGIAVTGAGSALGSDALDAIAAMANPKLDFDLSLNGAIDYPLYTTFVGMLEGGYIGGDSLSGSMTIPEPATIALFGLGGLALLRKRRA